VIVEPVPEGVLVAEQRLVLRAELGQPNRRCGAPPTRFADRRQRADVRGTPAAGTERPSPASLRRSVFFNE